MALLRILRAATPQNSWPGQEALRSIGKRFSHRERTNSVVALAGNLHFLGSRLLTCLTAVLVARLRDAFAWQMRTLDLFIRHSRSPFSFFRVCVER